VFQDEIVKEKAKGRTILLSSHMISEVEALADRVSIIRAGRIVQTGTLQELRGNASVTITATLAHPPADLTGLPMLHDARIDEHTRLTASVDSDQVNAAMAALVPHDMTTLTVSPASLEDLFLRQYGNTDATDPAGEPVDDGVHGAGRPDSQPASTS
jgi:ABC-2 type transport system ATP-binding protein